MIQMLQEIMGHASITTTLDLYGHLYPGDMDRHADCPRHRHRGGQYGQNQANRDLQGAAGKASGP